MAEIDQIQYGRLLASVEHLTAQLKATSAELNDLRARLEEVEGRFRVGKGTLIGLCIAIGGAAWSVKEMVFGLFGR